MWGRRLSRLMKKAKNRLLDARGSDDDRFFADSY
jgi:hypothetical protein